MNLYLTQPRATGNTAMRLTALAVFLCAASPFTSFAGSNTVTGTVYGDAAIVATAGSIASIENGSSDLFIGYSGTTNLLLSHDIFGSITITNPSAAGLLIDATAGATVTGSGAAVLTALDAANLAISGGRFLGSGGVEGFPSVTLRPDATGGYISNSTVSIVGSEFAGTNRTAGFVMERSDLTASNVVFRGGDSGIGLIALDHSTLTIHSGSVTGGVNATAFYLQNSDVTIHDGSFVGNIGETNVAGAGLFSELTGATTNAINLHGGTFSSLAFYGTNDAVQLVLAGTNLVVQNGIIQDGGTVIIDHQSNSALTDILVLSGTMSFPSNAFTLLSEGRFSLGSQESSARFEQLTLSSNATLQIGTGLLTANTLFADSLSTNTFAITTQASGFLDTQTAHFNTNATIVINASKAGIRSFETNGFSLISANTDQLFAGTSTNSAATEESFKQNVQIELSASERTQLVDLYFQTTNGSTLVFFQLTAMPLTEYWGLTNGSPTLVTQQFANELDQSAGSEMFAIIDDYFTDPASSLAAIEQTYFTIFNTFQTALQGMQSAVGPSAARSAEFREQLKLAPAGARGPQINNKLRGWGKYYGQRYNHDATGLNAAYDGELKGGTIGIDTSIGALLLGISGGAGHYLTTTGIDGESNIEAYHGALYGTFGIGSGYLDGGLTYGFNKVETQTGSPFVLSGDFDAQLMGAYLGVGYDLVDNKEGMVFTPEASIQYSMYEQEAYSETSAVAIPRHIEDFEADSLRGSAGLNVSVLDTIQMETFSLKYDIRAHWVREFNPNPGVVDFSLAGGDTNYQLSYPLLDEDFYRVGAGIAFFNAQRSQPMNVLFRIDFDKLFGDGFDSHYFSAKVIYAF